MADVVGDGDGSGLRFAVLGPLEASYQGRPLVLGGAKQQMVLALLLLEANRVVAAERLVEWVWSDDAGERSTGTLQVYMSNLRRMLAPAAEDLGHQVIVTRRPGYVVELDEEQLDLLRFESLRREGEHALAEGRPTQGLAHLRDALGLWRGEPLAGLPIDVTTGGALTRLEMARLTVMEQTAEAELAVGRHREFLDELEHWVRSHPLDERLRGLLMLALYRCERQAEALAVYREGRELLVEELGIDPSRELRELEGRILAQDASLDFATDRLSHFADASATVLRTSVRWTPGTLTYGDVTLTLDRPVVTIGRLPDRDIVIQDGGVSRIHAEVRRSADGHRVVDSGSANGTLVNGERITEHELVDGDVIRVGDTELFYRA